MAEDELYVPRGWDEEEDDEGSLECVVDEDVFRVAGKVVKMTFDEGEWHLGLRGARHPVPDELNAVLLAGVEGRLFGAGLRLFENLKKSEGEWLNVVFQNDYPALVVWVYPQKVVWDDVRKVYDCSSISAGMKVCFPLRGLPESGSVALRLFAEECPEFVGYLWQREYEDLPGIVKKNARVWIPPRGEFWPMARAGFQQYGIVGGKSYSLAAVRGVRT